ncbi:MAG: galactokinase [Armatimonadota bacterium]
MVEVQTRALRVSALQQAVDGRNSGVMSALAAVYGDAPELLERKRQLIAELLAAYRERYGDEEVIVARAPGRVNIMGRHVDHQGGMNNHIAIDHDFFMVAGKSDDGLVHLGDLDEINFPSSIQEIDAATAGYHGQPWLDFVNSPQVLERATKARGDWSQYVMAPIARLRVEFPDRPLIGMHVMAGGCIPMASGLSSSSAVVVATMEAVVRLNGIDLSDERFVELCGEGEWFVGTRGGTGDHAAMKYGRRGTVVQVGFFPFRQVARVDFPAGYALLVCNSQIRAQKTMGAKDIYNQRVACYQIGRELFKLEFPQYAERIAHLRDINEETLGVSYPELLGMLARLPMSITREEICARLDSDFCRRIFAGHSESIREYPVRPVVLYGLAETARSVRAPGIISSGDIATFGRWMNISHDGDRVATWTGDISTPFHPDCTDARLAALAAGFHAGLPDAVLTEQAGAYACSLPKIDFMVDTALSVEGVAGAQLAGAGLGGCIMVLVKSEAVEPLSQLLITRYYEPNGLEPALYTCYQAGGSGVLAL